MSESAYRLLAPSPPERSPELQAIRNRALAAYPDAVWLPGDPVPVSALVRRLGGSVCVVLGAATSDPASPWAYWWHLDDPGLPESVYEWPPSLRPVVAP